MSKSKDQKTKPYDLEKEIKRLTDIYDEGPIIHDPMSNTFKSEQQMIRENEVKAKGIYDHLTRNKNKKNVKVVKNKPIAQRRESLKAKLIPSVPMNLDLNLKISKQPVADAAENILKKIDNERNKVDPDTFKGLGTFLPRKL